MNDFKIRRGLSTTLFVAPGVVNPNLIVESGCWYLCTDTAELFIGLDSESSTTLHKINSVNLDDIKTSIANLKNIELFKEIGSENELPTDFDSEDFNPNITYFIPHESDVGSATMFIFNSITRSYLKVDTCSASGSSFVTDISWENLQNKPFYDSYDSRVMLGSGTQYYVNVDTMPDYTVPLLVIKEDGYVIDYQWALDDHEASFPSGTPDHILWTNDDLPYLGWFISKNRFEFQGGNGLGAVTLAQDIPVPLKPIDEKFIPDTIARISADELTALYKLLSSESEEMA